MVEWDYARQKWIGILLIPLGLILIYFGVNMDFLKNLVILFHFS